MAKRTVVQVTCDWHHVEDVPAETISVTTPDGQVFEVDLCHECQATQIAPLADIGRVVKRAGRRPRK
jgi:hypothetical protein